MRFGVNNETATEPGSLNNTIVLYLYVTFESILMLIAAEA